MTTDTEKLKALTEACKKFLHDIASPLMIVHGNSRRLSTQLPALINAYECALKAGLIEATVTEPEKLKSCAVNNVTLLEQLNEVTQALVNQLRQNLR